MPIHRLTRQGRTVYRWGDHGTLYPTRRQALLQMKAAFANGYRGRARPRQHMRRLRSGRRTMVNRGVRKSYGSWLFRQQAKERIKTAHMNKEDEKKFFHYLEKNPEMVERIGTTPITMHEQPRRAYLQFEHDLTGFRSAKTGYYVPKKRTISLSPAAIHQRIDIIDDGVEVARDMPVGILHHSPHKQVADAARDVSASLNLNKTLKHELTHRDQDARNQLPATPSYVVQGKFDRNLYMKDPSEIEAHAAELIPNERRIQDIHTPKKIEAGMRRLFG